jgi:hypothetical protein
MTFTDQRVFRWLVAGTILLVLSCLILLVSANTHTQAPANNSSGPVSVTQTVPVAPPRLSPEQEAKKQKVMEEEDRLNDLQRANRTFWQKKLDGSLLSLFESDSYIRTGVISEQDIAAKIAPDHLIPSDQVPGKFGITKTTGTLILVEIIVNKTASAHLIDPYAVNVTGTMENNIYCWIEPANLQNIASLKDVIEVRVPLGVQLSNPEWSRSE